MRCGRESGEPSAARLLCAPPRRQPVGHAGVARAIGEARGRLVSAKCEIRGAGIADWPAAFPLRQLEQRATLRAVDWYGLGGDARLPAALACSRRSSWRCGEKGERRLRGGQARAGARSGRPDPRPRR